MDNLIREGEQAAEGQMGGSNQGNMGDSSNYNQGGGNMGGGNDNSQGGSDMGGGNMNQQSGGGQSSGGGLLGGLEKTGESTMIDQEVNQFATKEGLPSAADSVIDQFVNKEV